MKKIKRTPKPKAPTTDKLKLPPALIPILDEQLIGSSAMIQCTDQEIAELCGIPLENLQETYGPMMLRQRALGKRKIREAMFNVAKSGLVGASAVAVWLSKQYLGMRDPEKEEKPDDVLDGVELVDYSKFGGNDERKTK